MRGQLRAPICTGYGSKLGLHTGEAGVASIAWGESANPRNELRMIQAPKRAAEVGLAFDSRNTENPLAEIILNDFGETKCLNHT